MVHATRLGEQSALTIDRHYVPGLGIHAAVLRPIADHALAFIEQIAAPVGGFI